MRIPTLLQKIGELAEHPDRRSRIDVDLMLDYTRVLYADLLEWRDKLSAPAPNPVSAPVPSAARSSGPAPVSGSTVQAEELNVPPGTRSTVMPDNRHLAGQNTIAKPPATSESPKTTVSEPPASRPPEIKEPTLAELAASMDKGGNEQEHAFRPMRPNYAQAAASNLTPPAQTGTDDSAANLPTGNKPEAMAEGKESVIPRDIRASISINEKYQIMSELFGNDKSAYENALDRINSAETDTAAIKWLQEQLWVNEDRGDSLQQFFDVVRRFKSQPEQGFLRFTE